MCNIDLLRDIVGWGIVVLAFGAMAWTIWLGATNSWGNGDE